MFYRIVAGALVLIGIFEILSHLSYPVDISPDTLEYSATGLATIFIGLLNLAYLYETPDSKVPMIVLLGSNLLFIGFAVLLITSDISTTFGYAAVGLSVINCIMVLNHKV
jgi:hypothetical protein